MPVSPARRAAFQILSAVEQRGAFVDEMLHRSDVGRLSTRDQGLLTEIVMGVLRRRGTLDWMIERTAKRKTEAIDFEALIALRIGAYQSRFLDKVPAHAAVSESVELVKLAGKPRAGGLVNAVLRRLPPPPPNIALDYPDWLVARWRQRLGRSFELFLSACVERPPTYIRFSRRFDAEETMGLLAAAGVELQPTSVDGAFEVTAGRVAGGEVEAAGRVRIQDVGAQAITPLLGLEPGMRLLDLCAAPGGKTMQAADLLGSEAGIVGADRYPARLKTMRRLGADHTPLVALDAEMPLPFSRRFDRVLVDAPCSGTGTLARNPDIKWRLRPADLMDLQRRQVRILTQALAAVRPEGRVVYATCSLEPEENEAVVRAVLGKHPEWRAVGRLDRIPGRDEGDGFFAVRIERASVG